jgi:hypothetical protein
METPWPADFFAKAGMGDAFVVMRFSGFEELYTDVIKPLAKEFGVRAYSLRDLIGGTPGSVPVLMSPRCIITS